MTDISTHFERVYSQLHSLAEQRFRGQQAGGTLQPTALVHEVYVRMARLDTDEGLDREHFLAIAATAMRQILVDHARRVNAAKRGGDWARITFDDAVALRAQAAPVDVLDLDRVLTELAALSPRQAQIVEQRVFAGMTVKEVALSLNVSEGTVQKGWRQARAWMRVALERGR
jgi:RNA polymerase sigma-70 factor (ECF subfamily)